MNDFDLPERRLPDHVRARRREELLATVRGEPSRRRGWLLPAAAAAAVAAVSVGAAVMVGGGDPEPGPAGSPAGTSSAAVPDAPSAPTPEETSDPTKQPEPERGRFPDRSPVHCADLTPVRNGTEAGAITIGETTVRVYSNGSQWATCDEWAALDGGPATLFAPHPVGAAPSKELFLVSMNFSMDDPGAAEYVAGGLLPEGVTGITYTFPGGHVEEAVIDGDVWAMAHFPDGGPMVADRLPTQPITVEVALSGTVQTYKLRGMDWCAQVNHGC